MKLNEEERSNTTAASATQQHFGQQERTYSLQLRTFTPKPATSSAAGFPSPAPCPQQTASTTLHFAASPTDTKAPVITVRPALSAAPAAALPTPESPVAPQHYEHQPPPKQHRGTHPTVSRLLIYPSHFLAQPPSHLCPQLPRRCLATALLATKRQN